MLYIYEKIIYPGLLFFTALSSYAGFFDKKPHFLSADEAFQFSIDQAKIINLYYNGILQKITIYMLKFPH